MVEAEQLLPITVHLHHSEDRMLWIATSPDVPGLYVAGPSRELVVAEIPDALDRLEAE